MKTKNIFRMLLVAAALLMGANNVKADTEVTVWNTGTTNTDYDAINLTIGDFTSKGAAKNKKLRVYARLVNDNWKIEIKTQWGNSLGFEGWLGDNDGKTINKDHSNAYTQTNTGGYFEMTISDTFFQNVTNEQPFQIQCWNMYVDSITIVTVSSSGTDPVDVTLSFNPTSLTVECGETVNSPTITAKAGETNVSGLTYTYSSNGTSIATVDRTTGAVTGVAVGETTITVSWSAITGYNEGSASYTVTVIEATTPPVSGELVDVNLGYYDYRTYVTPYVIDFSRSVGVEGYYAKEVSGNNIVFYQVTGTCASGVPLLLKKTDSASKLWKVTDTSVSGTTPDPNLLVAGNQTSPTVSGNNIYVLTYHNGGYVFAETEFQSAEVDNQHAYLDLNSVNSGNARAYSIRFVKGNTTGINDIKAETIDSNVIYDLRGQRVERPTKGIYIINGKKVMIK